MENHIIKPNHINGKPIFIFESHNYALIPWAAVSVNLGIIPRVISLDYHTDTHSAFCRYAYHQCGGSRNCAQALESQLCAGIDKYNEHSVYEAVQKLNHDEHIDAAIRSRIIDHSFSIQYQDPFGTPSIEQNTYLKRDRGTVLLERMNGIDSYPKPPYSYHPPTNRMFIVPNLCAIGCPRGPHTDDCKLEHANQALEDIFLQDKINHIQQMTTTSGISSGIALPYILDIDLDYFRTLRSANPLTKTVFHKLIRQSVAITIARETTCVEMLRLPGEQITSDQLEQIVLNHISDATA